MSIVTSDNPESRPSWGQRFRFARVWQQIVGDGDSDRAFGDFVGRSSTQVKEWEGLEAVPNTNALPKIATRTGVPLEWLTEDVDEPSEAFPDRRLFLAAWRRWLQSHPRRAGAEDELLMPGLSPFLRPATDAEAQRVEDVIHGAPVKKKTNGGRGRAR